MTDKLFARFTAILALSMLVIVGGNILRFVEAKRDGRLPPQSGVTALPGEARAPSGLGPDGRVSTIAEDR